MLVHFYDTTTGFSENRHIVGTEAGDWLDLDVPLSDGPQVLGIEWGDLGSEETDLMKLVISKLHFLKS